MASFLTTQLKDDVRTAHIPVILLTAKATAEQQVEGMKTKADAYITKPFDFSYLNNTIMSLLTNRHKLKEYLLPLSRWVSEQAINNLIENL